MKHLTKSVAITALVAAIVGFIAAPVVAAPTPSIEIGTFPVFTQKPIYYHNPPDTVGDPYVLMGNFDVYNLAQGVQFRWTLTTGANSYRVLMIQYDAPGKGPGGPSHVIKVGHHLSSDPNPNQYTMIGWGIDETFCRDCVSVIQVTPETATMVQDPQGAWDYQYKPLPGLIVSAPFVLEDWGSPATRRNSSPICGDGICASRERSCLSLYSCPSDCGARWHCP